MNDAREQWHGEPEVEAIPVTTALGARSVLATRAPPGPAHAALLVLPAMGVPAAYYAPLAEALARAGFLTGTGDLRGHGTSSVRPSRTVDFGYRELVTDDVPALAGALRARAPDLPLVLLGHSLGGQVAVLAASRSPELADGIVLVAACTLYHRSWGPVRGAGLRVLGAVARGLSAALGTFPGTSLRFAGTEARSVMNDWARNVRSGRYVLSGDDWDYEASLARLARPVLALSLEGDGFAPPQAVDHLVHKLRAADTARAHLGREELGLPTRTHFRWARAPGPVVARIARWRALALPRALAPVALLALTLASAACGRIHFAPPDAAPSHDGGRDAPGDGVDAEDGPTDDGDGDGDDDGADGADGDGADVADGADADGTADVADADPGLLPPTPLAPGVGEYLGSIFAPPAPDGSSPTIPLLRWTPVAAADHYELEATRACAPVTFPSCDFATVEYAAAAPTVSHLATSPWSHATVAPVGATYYWRVRACRGVDCSAWSRVSYFHLGRLADDLDGTGYSELAVGVPGRAVGFAPGAGVVMTFWGDGTTAPPATTFENPIPSSGAQFGWTVTPAGDVNADGRVDLLVGAPGHAPGGLALLAYGTAAGVGTAYTPHVPDAPEDLPRSGSALAAAGDVNGDGYDDYLVGLPGADALGPDAGVVDLFLGGPGVPLIRRTVVSPVPEDGAAFGAAVAGIGDLDADGFADFAVGAPREDAGGAPDCGAVFLFYGGPTGVDLARIGVLPCPGSAAGDRFGSVIAGGDLTGDRRPDLVVSAWGRDGAVANGGAIYFYVNAGLGLPAAPTGEEPAPLGGGDDVLWGADLSAGLDLRGDGLGDLAHGASRFDYGGPDHGVGLLEPGAATLPNPGGTWFSCVPFAGCGAGHLGERVRLIGDLNGDGFAEAAFGAPDVTESVARQGVVRLAFGGDGPFLDPVVNLRASPASADDGFGRISGNGAVP